VSKNNSFIHYLIDNHNVKQEPYYSLTLESNLADAIQIFKGGAHRIAITNSSQIKLVNILTQSNIIKFLAEDSTRMGIKAESAVREMHNFQKNVISIPSTWKTFDAFKKMVDCNVTSVAVVNEKGVLIGSLSCSDLKVNVFLF
jgi:predicted transcriptional regulator